MKRIPMPTRLRRHSAVAGLAIAVGLGCQQLQSAVAQGLGPNTDILYVGDASDNTVKIFRASDGASRNGANGAFVTPSGGLHGPTALLIAGPQLIVNNQNVNLPNGGEISQYQLNNGSFAGTWVSKSDPGAPFAPRGAVIKNNVLYVANFVEDAILGTPGQVLAFAGDGTSLGALVPDPAKDTRPFRPRGIVVGPDGYLYVSSDPNFAPPPAGGPKLGAPTTGGQVLRFDPDTLAFTDVVIDDPNSDGSPAHLNRPEGLIFGPDGKLYVTSFRASTADTDSIRIYDVTATPATFFKAIQLVQSNGDRAFAQALLFGPDDCLFVPITNTGEVRKYNVGYQKCTDNTRLGNGTYATFVSPGLLGAPFYLTFGRTDSATLAYPE
jgi:sugar lactone lactonase YvrE